MDSDLAGEAVYGRGGIVPDSLVVLVPLVDMSSPTERSSPQTFESRRLLVSRLLRSAISVTSVVLLLEPSKPPPEVLGLMVLLLAPR